MTAIVCDICKKAVPGARKDVNYWVFLEKDVCIPCKEQLEEVTKRQMIARQPYTLKDYWTTLSGNLTRMMGR
jgi:hypothetical protein